MRSRIALLIAHLVGNALLLWLGYYWLGLDESDAGHLIWSALVALTLIVGIAALHGFALAYFSGLTLKQAANKVAHNLLPLVVLSLLTLLLYGGLTWASQSFGKAAYVASSSATLALRKPIPPSAAQRVFEAFLGLLRWVALPSLLLPLAAAISVEGWRACNGRFLQKSKRCLYWIQVALLLAVAIRLPFKLFFWVPHISAFSGQMASFLLRAGLGYLLFVTAALALDFFTSSGNPRETQPTTVASP